MKSVMKRMSLLFVLAAGLIGCGQTKMLSTWKAPDLVHGAYKKPLVIAVFETQGVREVVEGQFVEQLQEEEVAAAASHAFLNNEDLSREAVVQRVRETGFDSVILARLLGQEEYDKSYGPMAKTSDVDMARDQTWYHDYVESTTSQAGSYTVASRRDVRVETRIFDAHTEKLVWTGVSETQIDGQDAAQIQDAVGAILSKLRQERLF
jgi:hypothetical protein